MHFEKHYTNHQYSIQAAIADHKNHPVIFLYVFQSMVKEKYDQHHASLATKSEPQIVTIPSSKSAVLLLESGAKQAPQPEGVAIEIQHRYRAVLDPKKSAFK